jgi:hypothetical protein
VGYWVAYWVAANENERMPHTRLVSQHSMKKGPEGPFFMGNENPIQPAVASSGSVGSEREARLSFLGVGVMSN